MNLSNPRSHRFAVDPVFTGVLQDIGHTLVKVRLQAAAPGGGDQANDYFNQWAVIVLTSGPARGELRRILDFDTATDDIIVDRPFTALPGVDTYKIYMALDNQEHVFAATGGSAHTITIGAPAGVRDGFWAGCKLDIIGGAGGNTVRPSNGRTIENFEGATGTVLVDRAFDGGPPDNTTLVRIHGHLYHPCIGLEIWEDGGALFYASGNRGAIANGVANKGAKYGDPGAMHQDDYVEIATDAVKTLNFHRWEV